MSWTLGDPLPAAFEALPAEVYRGDPLWIPEDPAALGFLFSPAHAYFERGRAALFVREGAARLAAFYEPCLYVEDEPAAFFGFWETVDDPEPNRALFAEAEAWAAAQGARRLYGPVNFTTHGTYRLRLGGFDEPPFPGEPYHPAWYPPLLEGLGYTVAARYVTHGSTRLYHSVMGELLLAKAHHLLRVPKGLRIEPLDGALWMDRLPELYRFVDEAFSHNLAYVPVPEATFRRLYGEGLAGRLCPRTSVVALDPEDRVAGFLLCFPDYGPLLQQGNPARLAPAALDYARHFPLLERPRFLAKTAAVRGDLRQRGLLSALSVEASRRSLEHYHDGMVCLMRQDSPSVRFALRFSNHHRTYGLFGKAL